MRADYAQLDAMFKAAFSAPRLSACEQCVVVATYGEGRRVIKPCEKHRRTKNTRLAMVRD